jgi:hypothetical protein
MANAKSSLIMQHSQSSKHKSMHSTTGNMGLLGKGNESNRMRKRRTEVAMGAQRHTNDIKQDNLQMLQSNALHSGEQSIENFHQALE